jgi:hypothetical protein
MSRAAPAPAEQLSRFDEATPASDVAGPAREAPAPDRPTRSPAVAPASPSGVPATFRHPQSDREIRLREHLVGYALRRVRRRSIGFIVGAEGLSVNALR